VSGRGFGLAVAVALVAGGGVGAFARLEPPPVVAFDLRAHAFALGVTGLG